MAFQKPNGKEPYKHKPNRGTLFDNDKKTKDTQPDMNGTIDIAGTIYWIHGWKEKTQSGKRKLSLSVQLQEERAPQAQQRGYQNTQRPVRDNSW